MKLAQLIPVHKSCALLNNDNYRPISVLPILSKVMEKLIQRQRMEFFDEINLLLKFQFEFRPRLSTELASTLLLDETRCSVDQDKLVGATFIDISKAFHTISHSSIPQNLPQYGISKTGNCPGSRIISSKAQQLYVLDNPYQRY